MFVDSLLFVVCWLLLCIVLVCPRAFVFSVCCLELLFVDRCCLLFVVRASLFVVVVRCCCVLFVVFVVMCFVSCL